MTLTKLILEAEVLGLCVVAAVLLNEMYEWLISKLLTKKLKTGDGTYKAPTEGYFRITTLGVDGQYYERIVKLPLHPQADTVFDPFLKKRVPKKASKKKNVRKKK